MTGDFSVTFKIVNYNYDLLELVIGPYSEQDVRLPNGLWDEYGWSRAMMRAFCLGALEW